MFQCLPLKNVPRIEGSVFKILLYIQSSRSAKEFNGLVIFWLMRRCSAIKFAYTFELKSWCISVSQIWFDQNPLLSSVAEKHIPASKDFRWWYKISAVSVVLPVPLLPMHITTELLLMSLGLNFFNLSEWDIYTYADFFSLKYSKQKKHAVLYISWL